MKSRRSCREAALQALYLCDSLGDFSAETQHIFSAHFLSTGLSEGEDLTDRKEIDSFYQEIVAGVVGHLAEIDTAIGLASTHWSLQRMAIVDRNIIRIAAYEILYRSDVPPRVSINEAIEIAKEFAAPEAVGFINGVLDKVASQLPLQEGQHDLSQSSD